MTTPSDFLTDAQLVLLLSPTTPYAVRKDTLTDALVASYKAGIQAGKDILVEVLEPVFPGIREATGGLR
jgi:hypothetical protein